MKKMFILAILALLVSCGGDDFLECGCAKYTQLKNGDLLHREEVECQPEIMYGQDEQGRVYFIECNTEY